MIEVVKPFLFGIGVTAGAITLLGLFWTIRDILAVIRKRVDRDYSVITIEVTAVFGGLICSVLAILDGLGII